MKLKLVALAAVAALALCGVAAAKSNLLTGRFKGDLNSKLTVRAVLDHGVVTRVSSFRIRNFDFICASGAGEQTINVGAFKVVKRKRGGRTVYTIGRRKKIGSDRYRVVGTFSSRRGRKITGKLFFTPTRGGETCTTTSASFTARKE